MTTHRAVRIGVTRSVCDPVFCGYVMESVAKVCEVKEPGETRKLEGLHPQPVVAPNSKYCTPVYQKSLTRYFTSKMFFSDLLLDSIANTIDMLAFFTPKNLNGRRTYLDIYIIYDASTLEGLEMYASSRLRTGSRLLRPPRSTRSQCSTASVSQLCTSKQAPTLFIPSCENLPSRTSITSLRRLQPKPH